MKTDCETYVGMQQVALYVFLKFFMGRDSQVKIKDSDEIAEAIL